MNDELKIEMTALVGSLIQRKQITVMSWDDETPVPDYTHQAEQEISNCFYLSDKDLLVGIFQDHATEVSGEFAQANLDPCQITFANLGQRLMKLINADITDQLYDVVSLEEVERMLFDVYETDYLMELAGVDAADYQPWDIESRNASYA